MISRDMRFFFLRWLRNPLRIGAPIPSGRPLADAMAAELPAVNPSEYVVELGPGTGVVTHALARKGLPMRQLVIVEREEKFLGPLREAFPEAMIVRGDACDMKEILHSRNITQVACVVSSLPLLAMPDAVRHRILSAAFEVMKPEGVFIQFSYGLRSPLSDQHQRSIGIRGSVCRRVWRNFPPARVWNYRLWNGKVEKAA